MGSRLSRSLSMAAGDAVCSEHGEALQETNTCCYHHTGCAARVEVAIVCSVEPHLN